MSTLAEFDVAAVGRFYLARLERFARLAGLPDVDAVPRWRDLARHATLTAYRDCLALGLGAEARRLLASARPGDASA
jgi:hypothetical protein